MESRDEDRAKLEEQQKVIEARRLADARRKEIEKKRLEAEKNKTDSFSSNSIPYYNQEPSPQKPIASEPVVLEPKREVVSKKSSGKEMKLGQKEKIKSGYSQILKEEKIPDVTKTVVSKQEEINDVPSALVRKVNISIHEKILLQASNGGIKNMEVLGEFSVTVNDPNFVHCKIQVSQGENSEFQFKAHPNINKQLFNNSNILAPSSKPYLLCSQSMLLKWRFPTKDEKMIPLTVNVWPSTSGKETNVPVEFEKKCNFDLTNVVISIPVPDIPNIGEMPVGNYDYDPKKGCLNWRIPLIDSSNASGNMDFTVPIVKHEYFLPLRVQFTANQTYCAIQAVAVTSGTEQDETCDFGTETILDCEQYEIE